MTGGQKEAVGVAGVAIRAARQAAGMSLQQLAEKTGISKSWISTIERGRASPTVDTLERLAAAMGGKLVIAIMRTKEKIK